MARLKSELEVACPCCQTILVIDTNLGRVISHKEPDRGNKPELSDAQRILAASRRAAVNSPSDQRASMRRSSRARLARPRALTRCFAVTPSVPR